VASDQLVPKVWALPLTNGKQIFGGVNGRGCGRDVEKKRRGGQNGLWAKKPETCWKQKMLIDVKKKRNEQTEQAELLMGVHT
jgi:hypothetical protein